MSSRLADGSSALAAALRQDEARLHRENLARALWSFLVEAAACGTALCLIAWARAAWLVPLDPGAVPTPAMNFYGIAQNVLLVVMIGLPVFRLVRAVAQNILDRRGLSRRSDEDLLHEDLLRRML